MQTFSIVIDGVDIQVTTFLPDEPWPTLFVVDKNLTKGDAA